METWRLFTTWGAPPEFNMGLDEALLASPIERPTLRLYSWNPPTLSLGYFQRFDDVPAASQARSVVRRITGGGAIHHQNELTFSIAASQDHPLYRGPVAASYERVHRAIIEALSGFGVEASLAEDAALESDRDETGMCFHAGTPLDIAWNGRKGVGSAQRRTKGRVLHHGSIKLGTTRHEGEIATLEEVAGRVEPTALARALTDSFGRHFDVSFETSVPGPDERTAARDLGVRYLDPEFVRRR